MVAAEKSSVRSSTALTYRAVAVFFPKGEALTPSLLKLMTMKGTDGESLNIISRIAASKYKTFGMCLLQDENGDEGVGLLKKTHTHDGPEGITEAIIQKWLTSGAAPTRTYQHLIECLRQSELGTLKLAEDIANTLVATGIKELASLCQAACSLKP